jgi:aspartyl-tRNA(Asn)/glutamyl-tRNA(Gln) amidotransferase subunit A
MARCVPDLALLLQTLAGADPRDHACSRRPVPDYVSAITAGSAPRLGRVRGYFEERAEPAVRAMLEEVTRQLRTRGATITEVALPAAFAEVVPRHRTVMAVEAAAYHRPRLERHPEDYPPRIRALLEEGLACPAPEYSECKRHQEELRAAMQPCFEDVDALLTPATTCPAPDASTTGDPAFNSPWSYTGLPTVSLPCGWTEDGMPVAIQLVGAAWQEATILQTGTWCECMLEVNARDPELA